MGLGVAGVTTVLYMERPGGTDLSDPGQGHERSGWHGVELADAGAVTSRRPRCRRVDGILESTISYQVRQAGGKG
jgi:hypothetical protein